VGTDECKREVNTYKEGKKYNLVFLLIQCSYLSVPIILTINKDYSSIQF
jgi:hypothetical protein